MFLVFEGADGSGKTTQVNLLAERLRRQGYRVVTVREPGGTAVGEKVREILLDPATGDIETQTELFLFLAARAELVARRIRPAIDSGSIVISDRYLWSSVAYQGMAAGLGWPVVMRVGRLAASLKPTMTFILDVPTEIAFGRTAKSDRMEKRGFDFQEQVRRGYLLLAGQYPKKVAVIDGRGTPGAVHRRVVRRLPDRGWKILTRSRGRKQGGS